MACHELGALRLGLMKVLGIENEAAKNHDENEVGEALHMSGPLQSLSKSKDLKSLQSFFETAVSDLEIKISKVSADDKDLPYFRSLLILTKKIELDLEVQIKSFEGLWRNLDEVHDYVHEIYPY